MEKQQNYLPCCRITTKSNIQYTKCDKTFMCKHFCGIWLGAIAANSNEIWFFVRSFFFISLSHTHSIVCYAAIIFGIMFDSHEWIRMKKPQVIAIVILLSEIQRQNRNHMKCLWSHSSFQSRSVSFSLSLSPWMTKIGDSWAIWLPMIIAINVTNLLKAWACPSFI